MRQRFIFIASSMKEDMLRRSFRPVLISVCCSIPQLAFADTPSSPADVVITLVSLLSLPLMILFTIAYLFARRPWLMAFVLLAMVGTFFSTLVWGIMSSALSGLLILACIFCLMLVLLKRLDHNSLKKAKDSSKAVVTTSHPNVRVYRMPVFRR
jgi:hypothetical protein